MSEYPYLVLGAAVVVSLWSSCAEATSVSVDPRATFLRADITDDSGAQPPLVISLASIGIAPGDDVRIRRLGDFSFGDFDGENPSFQNPPFTGPALFFTDTGHSMIGIFSNDATVLPQDQLNRVPGALEAGDDWLTQPNCVGDMATTDIPQDFSIDLPEVVVTVPIGAQYLMVGVEDCYYEDNSDHDLNFGGSVEQVTAPLIETALDDCDVQQRANTNSEGDIRELITSADGVDVFVHLVLCGPRIDTAEYTVKFDTDPHASLFNPNCLDPADVTIVWSGGVTAGPATSVTEFPNALTFEVPYSALNALGGDRLHVWARARFRGLTDQVPNPEAGDRCSEPQQLTDVLSVFHLPE